MDFCIQINILKRICLHLVRQLDDESSKVGHFQISKWIFEVKCKSIFLKPIFSFEYWLGEQFSLKAFIFFTNLIKLYWVKMCLIFAGLSSSCLTRYKQMLLGCSFGTKNLLNFTCSARKCHDRSYTNGYEHLSGIF